MSERREAQAKEDTFASRAEPRPEGRVGERGWRPTRIAAGFFEDRVSAARPRATDAADTADTEAVSMPNQTGGRQ